MTQLTKTMLRVALTALGLLMVPLLASQVVDGWKWETKGFVFADVMFFGTRLAYALIARKMAAWAYKAAVGLALVNGFVMGDLHFDAARSRGKLAEPRIKRRRTMRSIEILES
jgi:hypothetical protein